MEHNMQPPGYDENSEASDPGKITLSLEKLKLFHPELFPKNKIIAFLKSFSPDNITAQRKEWIQSIATHLQNGDSRAAMVIRTSPLCVAAYTDELDCILLLSFPEFMDKKYNLKYGDKLLTVNIYFDCGSLAPDLEPGVASLGRYTNFVPFIADFLSDDVERLDYRKFEITDTEWNRTLELAERYIDKYGMKCRDGRPIYVRIPVS